MNIRIFQSAEQTSKKRWDWSIWIDGPSDALDAVRSVTYQLHPTFKNPIRDVDDRNTNFRLSSRGWGQFMIYLTIHHTDGTEEKRQHWLMFGENAPNKELEERVGTTFRAGSPTAYLSYSIVDKAAAMAVRRNLEDQGISVLDPSTLAVGDNLSDGIEDLINRSDFGVTIVSDVNSDFMDREVSQMKNRNLPLLEVSSDNSSRGTSLNLKVQPTGGVDSLKLAGLIDSTFDLSEM